MDKALKLISRLEETTMTLISLHSNLEVITAVVGDESREPTKKTMDDVYGALSFTSEVLLGMAVTYEVLTQKLKGEIENG